MNVQRSNPFQRSNRQEDGNEEGNHHFGGYNVPMGAVVGNGSFHGQGYDMSTLPSLPPPLPPPQLHQHQSPSNQNQFVSNHHHFHDYMPPSRVPQTPSPRSWDLTSPPKPRRVTSTALPFPVPHAYPVQARYMPRQPQVPRNMKMSSMTVYHPIVIGNPSLKIFRLRLPPHLLDVLDAIIDGCEAYAATLPNGWLTDLYSLTKQDIALRKIPHLYNAAKPIVSYMKRSILALFGARSLRMDRNQPHVLKYSAEDGHTGVELHHDKCDVTANLCLSRSTSYVGGGTTFPAARQVVRLEKGEFLVHPGSLVHGGLNISNGTRHLMILFANFSK